MIAIIGHSLPPHPGGGGILPTLFCPAVINFSFSISVIRIHSFVQFAMLHLVGLGLADEKDITVRGLEIVKKADRVYL